MTRMRNRAAAWSSAALFGITSTTTVFINKALFHVYDFKAPATLVTGQMIFSIILIYSKSIIQRNLLSNAKDDDGDNENLSPKSPLKIQRLSKQSFLRVGPLSALFLLKLLLDMSALSLINIPMYGVLKSATSLFVLILEYAFRNKKASIVIQLSILVTTLGGFIAGFGDLTFDMTGYILALSSAATTAAYIVVVGILGEDFKMDSSTMLLYNAIWSAPVSIVILILNNEIVQIISAMEKRNLWFAAIFILSCASAFILNLSTYLCTLHNSPLTTSVVARTKTILQGIMGLFAFGDVIYSITNIFGLFLNTVGVSWYAWIKISTQRKKTSRETSNGHSESNLLPFSHTKAAPL